MINPLKTKKKNFELYIVFTYQISRTILVFYRRAILHKNDQYGQQSYVTLFLLVLLHRHASNAPFLKFGRWDKTRGTSRVILPRLPPMMIILADDLQNVTGSKSDSSLCAGYQFIFQWIVVELRSNENLLVHQRSR